MADSQITLTPEQTLACDKIVDWFKGCKLATSFNVLTAAKVNEFKLGGYAGTGKTTLIKQAMKAVSGTANVCAFTGKAAFVLQTKGIPASTIHSLIYEPIVNEVTHQITYRLKAPYELQCDLIIVDEASMVSHGLYTDLKSFNKPILFVGDPGQLEPIGDNPNLMKSPDFTLKTIHRQAQDSPIIMLATAIRTGGPAYDPRKFGTHEGIITFQTKNLTPELLHGVDQIITARNITRTTVNNKIRRDKGFTMYDGIHEGEKLICLKNDKDIGCFNGQIMWVHEIKDERPTYFECLVEFEGLKTKRVIPIWSEPFYREINDDDKPPKQVSKCDFGYCITCHKAQGSEYDHVLVVDEYMGRAWDMARWRYTAVTRASKRLNYAM